MDLDEFAKELVTRTLSMYDVEVKSNHIAAVYQFCSIDNEDYLDDLVNGEIDFLDHIAEKYNLERFGMVESEHDYFRVEYRFKS